MQTIFLSSIASLGVNYLALLVFMPVTIGFSPVIVLPITFWTVIAATGAIAVKILLEKLGVYSAGLFVGLAFIVFFLSFIALYLHLGIFRDVPPQFTAAAARALFVMHSADSVIITALVIRRVRFATMKSK